MNEEQIKELCKFLIENDQRKLTEIYKDYIAWNGGTVFFVPRPRSIPGLVIQLIQPAARPSGGEYTGIPL